MIVLLHNLQIYLIVYPQISSFHHFLCIFVFSRMYVYIFYLYNCFHKIESQLLNLRTHNLKGKNYVYQDFFLFSAYTNVMSLRINELNTEKKCYTGTYERV